MGNNPSRNSGSNPQSPATGANPQFHSVSPGPGQRKEPQRRGSIQALSSATKTQKATAAPPSASLESTTAHSFARTGRPSSRSISHVQGGMPPHLKPLEEVAQTQALSDGMGASTEALSKEGDKSDLQPQEALPIRQPSPMTKPVEIPSVIGVGESARGVSATPVGSLPSGPEKYHLPSVQYSQPPRLPLPIQEEVHTPGSPIISPADLDVEIEPVDSSDPPLPSRGSVLSNVTQEDEEALADFNGLDRDNRAIVPTLFEWRAAGDKVYVTGTFAGWDRKYRLQRNGPSPHKDALSSIIYLPPGTHHVKFIVDNEMKLSDDLPTAVDFTNILVNYLEVALPEQMEQADTQPQAPEIQPVTTPPVDVPAGMHPPLILPPTVDDRPAAPPTTAVASSVPEPPVGGGTKPRPIVPTDPKKYHQEIPRYLLDLDANEKSRRYARANVVLNNMPAPPTLPMFLNKSILNGQTPMKDDSSVLIMPNHTVLNHLATSSIRNNVLATSATTRYKRKFLTTIMYKPTNDSND